MAEKKYLQTLTDDEFEKVLKPYDRTLEMFNEDVTNILNWLSVQPHLPRYTLARSIVAYSLYQNKCSVEKTKSKMEWLFTVHTMVPEFFKNCLPWSKNMMLVQKYINIVMLPKLTQSKESIICMKLNYTEDDNLNPDFVISFVFNTAFLGLLTAKSSGRIFVVDGKHAKLSYMRNATPTLIKKLHTICKKIFSMKFSSINFINTPPFFSPFISIVKQLLSKKLQDRFIFHEDYESLKKAFSKECLPKDYGGDLPLIAELQEKMNEEFLKQKDFFEARENWMVDESKRPEKLNYSEIFGTQGNFRKLDVD